MTKKQFEEAIPVVQGLLRYTMKGGCLVMVCASSESETDFVFIRVPKAELDSFELSDEDRRVYEKKKCRIQMTKDQKVIVANLEASLDSLRSERDKAQLKAEIRSAGRLPSGGFFLQGGAPGLGKRH